MNAMTRAFLIPLNGRNIKGDLGQKIANAKGGRFKEGWNCKLSYRTHQALVADGYTRFTGA